MSELVQTTSDSLCKLVRWAHSHGTICNLIPGLRQHHGNALTPETALHGSRGGGAVAVWGCSAGHAYHWPLGYYDNGPGGPAGNSRQGQGQERFTAGRSSSKVPVRASCDLSCSEPASEGEEFNNRLFDMGGCDSSATDEDVDYEPCPSSRKRGRGDVAAGGPAGSGGGGTTTGKKIKQETVLAEDYYPSANMGPGGLSDPDPAIPAQTNSLSSHINTPSPHTKPLVHYQHAEPQTLGPPDGEKGEELACEGLLMDPEMELLGGGSCSAGPAEHSEQAPGQSSATETTDQIAGTGGQCELERLRVLLRTERSRNVQMIETISSLKQDKELLQNELTKKAELICDFLQDQLRPEKRRPQSSNQVEPGSSQMPFPDEPAAFDSPVLFDSFEEVELHSLERNRALKIKRSREGENTRVRMKNVVGVIARYMAALQEFRRSVSMKVAFDRVGVDRNTISRTAAIAELSLSAPEVFRALAPWDEKEETLAHYAHRCRQAMDDNIKAKIKAMKAKGDLLPIVSKDSSPM